MKPILISEQKPEVGKDVLLYDGRWYTGKRFAGINCIGAKYDYFSADGKEVDYPEEFNPTHWMPLPEAPGCEKKRKIVITPAYGGFALSEKAMSWLRQHGANPKDAYDPMARDDAKLIECIKSLGEEAGDDLEVIEIPFDIEWKIIEFDGAEYVYEAGRIWQ